MIDDFERHDIVFAEVKYQDGTGSKARPAYVLKFDGDVISTFRVTTQYENKSEYVKSRYFKIIDFLKAGLSRQSYIDTMQIYDIDPTLYEVKFMGRLTEADRERLFEFLKALHLL